MANKKRTLAAILVLLLVLIFVFVLLMQPRQSAISQPKPTPQGPWARFIEQMEKLRKNNPELEDDMSTRFGYAYTLEAEEKAYYESGAYLTPLPTGQSPGEDQYLNLPVDTGISNRRFHLPPGAIVTSSWREKIDGKMQSVMLAVARTDETLGYILVDDPQGDYAKLAVFVPGNKGAMTILKRDGDLLIIKINATDERLVFNWVTNQLFDSSKTLLGEVTPHPEPTQPSNTPTPDYLPYP